MDYDIEMLYLYFKELGYDEERITELLEDNPFGHDYMFWEKQKHFDNRKFANTIKKLKLVNYNDKLCEICVSPKSSVTSSFLNEKVYIEHSVKKSLDVYVPSDSKVIINGLYINQNFFLKRINNIGIPFIVGISTIDVDYFDECYKAYEEMYEELNCNKYVDSYGEQKIYMLFSKRHPKRMS